MGIPAIVYTAAATTLIVLMVTRTPIDPTPPMVMAEQGTESASATANTPEATLNQSDTDIAQANETNTNSPDNNSTVNEGEPDYAREQRLVEQIKEAIFDGEVISLTAGDRDFMAIQTDADEPAGAAIILHGRGFHADWADVVQPLRVGLVEEGWTTLSLQLPVLEKQAKYYDYVPLFPYANQRISAAIAYLKQQGIEKIVLIAHSCGGHMGMDWIRQNGDSEISAFVGLGLGATDYQQYMAEPFPLAEMKVPVFDVYGENDFPAVLKMAPERLQQIQAADHPKSAQVVLEGADHYFTDKGEALTTLVADWLNALWTTH